MRFSMATMSVRAAGKSGGNSSGNDGRLAHHICCSAFAPAVKFEYWKFGKCENTNPDLRTKEEPDTKHVVCNYSSNWHIIV